MGGEIHLDDTYNSGIPNFPGTRFVVNLKAPPYQQELTLSTAAIEAIEDSGNGGEGKQEATTRVSLLLSDRQSNGDHKPVELSSGDDKPEEKSNDDHQPLEKLELPESISVLFVDDDAMLRKLFLRSIKRVAPGWTCREAGSGEAALQLVESESFDIIFMDMYMASVEKQLLGTETVVELRARGIQCKICGLSANDKKIEFLEAGADSFLIKPFPCKPDLLSNALLRLLYPDATGYDYAL